MDSKQLLSPAAKAFHSGDVHLFVCSFVCPSPQLQQTFNIDININ